jgi:hypothetical protein
MELRREIHEGLNVIESWNGANDFILYGPGGELATNRLEDQEATMRALHLLQNCMVYVNTLMLQRVLGEPIWLERMGANERRAMTPLFWGHVNPYGTFQLDMTAPPAPRSADVGSQCRSATAARRLTLRATRYFALGDTNVVSAPTDAKASAVNARSEPQSSRRLIRRRSHSGSAIPS